MARPVGERRAAGMIHGNLATCRSTGKASQRLVPVPTARICDHPDRTTTTHLARGLAVLFPVVAANPPSRYLPVMLIVVLRWMVRRGLRRLTRSMKSAEQD